MSNSEVIQTNLCCFKHLERMGHGILLESGQFIINGNHCIDGQRARCATCHTVWEHVCDEAEGCSWMSRSRRK